MYRKPQVRRILEYLKDGLSVREIARMLHVSRNTISRIQMSARQSERSLEELLRLEDDLLYEMFFPEKFAKDPIYADINFAYVHNELKKTGVTLKLLWEEYCEKCRRGGTLPCSYSSFTRGYSSYTVKKNYTSAIRHRPGEAIEVDWAGPTMRYRNRDTGKDVPVHLFVATLPYSQYVYVEGTESMTERDWLSCHVNMFRYFGRSPIKIICDNLKAAVIKHPRKAPAVINESYLSLAEHYNVAIIPTQVKKPKQKASVEGSVGKITMHVIAKLRNEQFSSLKGVNDAIEKVLEEFNSKPFQKRTGSRKTVYETEEKPCMRELPVIPYEVCEWSYGCRVGADSHIWFSKCQYSVPHRYIGQTVDVKYNAGQVFIYHNHYEIARHERFGQNVVNAKRTDESHLPIPLKQDESVESLLAKAKEIGPSTFEVVRKMFEDAKVKAQPSLDVMAMFSVGKDYPPEALERACKKALLEQQIPMFSDVKKHLNPKDKHSNATRKAAKKSEGLVRGADYYKGGQNK
ncbi:MAG: IS21 family transposase [Oribacterium sp.]|nr:IS21 family transposase [Oribacterium sp.]